MTKTIMNLTLPAILEEIDHVLEEEPYRDYQPLLRSMEMRQELIAYTLSRVHSRYRVIEGHERLTAAVRSLSLTSEERLNIEKVVRQGVYDLLKAVHLQNSASNSSSSSQIISQTELADCLTSVGK
ncbi:hypothetical protein [Leptolyngbya sp. 7M]|uniref:hypothetical protein n=1 Tax=Leptolyngbya sp. 7M TaxID=2812896 RepID=UPI001B8B76D1|nr:hypothetical protein [Leptolyngbya sp. 7M]QYO62251.1 hypothetical protein JVX88_19320 [Leptolyngbya sp. 7M]